MHLKSTLAVFKQTLKLTSLHSPHSICKEKKKLKRVSSFHSFPPNGNTISFLQSHISNSCLPYHLSHRHFHQFLPAEDSIHTLRGHVGLAFLPWLEKAEKVIHIRILALPSVSMKLAL